MSDIESMKAELEAAGYKVVIGDMSTQIYTPDYWEILYSFSCHEQNAIEKAYAHYQREKKFAAMEALLDDMLGNELYLDTDDRRHPSTQLLGWIRRAEELLK